MQRKVDVTINEFWNVKVCKYVGCSKVEVVAEFPMEEKPDIEEITRILMHHSKGDYFLTYNKAYERV